MKVIRHHHHGFGRGLIDFIEAVNNKYDCEKWNYETKLFIVIFNDDAITDEEVILK